VEDAVLAEETQGVTAYATELATQFHAFYRDARVVDADQPERVAETIADWAKIRQSADVDAFILAWIASHVDSLRRECAG
jgi:hypothetical protein